MKAFKLASLSGAVTAALALGASAGLTMPVVANAAELTINGTACGTYQQATFNRNGTLALTGVAGCDFGGGTPVDPTPDPDPDPDPDPGPGPGPEEPGDNGIPSYCANQNPTIQYTLNGYSSSPRQTARLAGLQDYVAEIVPEEGVLGYGSAISASTAGMVNTRTLAISECPGDFTDHLPEQGTCIAQGQQNISLKWSYLEDLPRGMAQCRLEEGKTYYFNVRNAAMESLDKASCTSGTCNSYFEVKSVPYPSN